MHCYGTYINWGFIFQQQEEKIGIAKCILCECRRLNRLGVSVETSTLTQSLCVSHTWARGHKTFYSCSTQMSVKF